MTTTKKGENLKKVEDKKEQQKPAKSPTVAERIKFYREQAELVELRLRYQTTRDNLEAVEVDEKAEFLASDYSSDAKFTFQHERKTLVSISQPDIVKELRNFLVQKCTAKIQEVDKLLLK